MLVPDLGPLDTYEQGLYAQETRGSKGHLCALENIPAVRICEKGTSRTIQMIPSLGLWMPSDPTTRRQFPLKFEGIKGHILLPLRNP